MICHRIDGAWSALIAQPTETGLSIEAAHRCSDADLPGWVAGQSVGSIRVVLPGARTVCRSVALGEDVDEALLEQRLHADVHGRPMADEPPHRIAAALLPPVEGVSGRTGLFVSWPSTDAGDMPSLGRSVLSVPDVVGLLSMVSVGDAAALVDTDAGSLSLVLQGPSRLTARCMREPDPTSALQGALTETAALAGLDSAQVSGTGALRLSPAASEALLGRCTGEVPQDTALFGVAIGCALAATGPLAPLTVLQQRAPRLRTSRRERAIASMRTRRTAVALLIAAIALLFIGPIAVSAARLAILEASHPELATAVASAKDAKSRSQYYQVLSRETWPMTKLLADIGAAAPLGVVIEQIRIDNGEPIRIRGHATPKGGASAADLITRMKANLQASKVFNEVTVEWDGKKRIGQREFTMVASVRNAQLRPRYADEHDFAAWTHQQRIYNLPATADGGPPARPSELGGWDPVAQGSAPMPPSKPDPVDLEQDDTNADEPSSEGNNAETAVADGSGNASNSDPAGNTGRRPRPGHDPSRRPGTGDDEVERVDPSTINRVVTAEGGHRPEIDRPSGNAASSGSVSVGSAEFQSGDLDSGALGAMPQILTAEQVATLNADELRARIGEVAQARNRVKDEAQKEALKAYFKLLFDQLMKVNEGNKN
ncbi:MAG: hypothetical protein MK101_09170 [Phycisphaerales bacterium]|nr:hypothetical protein [Phycisphaerales bacterium]